MCTGKEKALLKSLTDIATSISNLRPLRDSDDHLCQALTFLDEMIQCLRYEIHAKAVNMPMYVGLMHGYIEKIKKGVGTVVT